MTAKTSKIDEGVNFCRGHSGLTPQTLNGDLGALVRHCVNPLGLPQPQPAPPLPTVRYKLGEPCPPQWGPREEEAQGTTEHVCLLGGK